MERRRTKREQLITSAAAVELVAMLGRFATAAEYHRMARRTEAKGYPYTAALQWRKAAALFDSEDSLSDSCWRQWERIMHLSRAFSGPIL